jgi:hypothetical protein
VDAGSVLGVPAVRTSLLDHVSSAGAAQAEARRGADDMIADRRAHDYSEESSTWLADDVEDDLDDDLDDDEFGDEDDETDDDEEDEDAEEPETWQVFGKSGFTLKTVGGSLDFGLGTCLDWRPLASSSELAAFGGLRVCLAAQSLDS